MKASKLLLLIAGGLAIVLITVGITLGVQKAIYTKRAVKRMPHLAGILGKERPRGLLKTIKIVRAVEALELNEDQIGKVLSRWNKLNEMREEYFKTRKEKVTEIDRLLRAEEFTEELQDALTGLRELEEKFYADCKTLKDEIDTFLTTEQQAKLIIFEKNFHRQMQRLLGRTPGKEKALNEEAVGIPPGERSQTRKHREFK